MKRAALSVVLMFLLVFQFALPASALSLKMQPLIYNDTLAKGEKKKGFIDVSNPTRSTVRLKTSVQAFRQIDDKGSLEFYDDPQMSAGIIPDLSEFELGPREALRMYFLIDGSKLPSGDVFGALFVSTTLPKSQTGASSALRLGTLFTIVNGTPGPRNAAVTDIRAPFWQFGDSIQGSYSIKNVAKVSTATGFFPAATIAIDPIHKQQQSTSSLVFAGRTRQNDFQIKTSRLGFYKISATYGASVQEKWVFAATGYWPTALIITGLLVIAGFVVWWRLSSGRRRLGFKRR